MPRPAPVTTATRPASMSPIRSSRGDCYIVRAQRGSTRMDTSSARLADVVRVFLRLGLIAFGGPAAHVALFEQECVRRLQWIDRRRFLDLLAVANLVPGPTSTELAIHIGRVRAG